MTDSKEQKVNNSLISNLPPKGTYDWLPEEYRIRKYIFDTWRKVCLRFGYLEYLTPIMESAALYRAKSGEDVGGKELMTFQDRAGRDLALRPEMTPSVTRMLTRVYGGLSKPVRLFSIANFVRNEKPQRGRNREFWQLNFDIFGSNSIWADLEILQMSLEIMLAFNPPAGSFKMNLNSRKLLNDLFELARIPAAQATQLARILDKFAKLAKEDFQGLMATELGLQKEQQEVILKFMESTSESVLLENLPELDKGNGLTEIRELLDQLKKLGYADWVEFKPNVIRGFDYYDGMIFEVFDTNPTNPRSLFGGGRYNGLAKLFVSTEIPAVGVAPGDETTRLFLEGWNLLDKVREQTQPETIYFPLLDESVRQEANQLAKQLRQQGLKIEMGLEVQQIAKALQYANKQMLPKVLIFGTTESAQKQYKLKTMSNGEEQLVSIELVRLD